MAKPFDLGQAIEDFELIGRMREARKFPQLLPKLTRISHEQLAILFEAISQAVAEGLSLRGAAALVGVSHRLLALWIRRAEDDTPPYAAWLASILRRDSELRRQALGDLRKMAMVDAGAQRELVRQVGMASALERELDLLRRVKSAVADAYFAPVDAAREFKRNEASAAEPSGTASERTDIKSVAADGEPSQPAETAGAESGDESRVCNSPVPANEPEVAQ